ncbi:MAG TPA: hypothetical protein VF469_34465 [Kofleriaceae bacterium]
MALVARDPAKRSAQGGLAALKRGGRHAKRTRDAVGPQAVPSLLLKDVIHFTQKRSAGLRYRSFFALKTHISLNLEDRRDTGIPALIRSRDS